MMDVYILYCIAENAVYDAAAIQLNTYDAKAVYEPVMDNEQMNVVCCQYTYVHEY